MMTEPIPSAGETKPLLTIAIPTYNRARYLRELLSILFDQLVAEPRVELIISDNASPDETPALVAEFQERGLSIRSIRNEVNVGADANFLQCFEQARGKYVWIFGDDDVIVPGGVAKVLSHLETGEYDLIYLNSFGLTGSYVPQLQTGASRAFDTTDAMFFVGRVHVYFTFISGNIINKHTVGEKGANAFASLVGSNLVQLGWTYQALNGFRRGLHIQDRLVGARINNTGGYKLLEVFGPTLKFVTENWLQSERLQRVVMNGTLQRFWPGMSLEYKRAATVFAQEDHPDKILSAAFKNNPRYWVFVYPILRLPSGLASCWLLLARAVNRLDRASGFVMLRHG